MNHRLHGALVASLALHAMALGAYALRPELRRPQQAPPPEPLRPGVSSPGPSSVTNPKHATSPTPVLLVGLGSRPEPGRARAPAVQPPVQPTEPLAVKSIQQPEPLGPPGASRPAPIDAEKPREPAPPQRLALAHVPLQPRTQPVEEVPIAPPPPLPRPPRVPAVPKPLAPAPFHLEARPLAPPPPPAPLPPDDAPQALTRETTLRIIAASTSFQVAAVQTATLPRPLPKAPATLPQPAEEQAAGPILRLHPEHEELEHPAHPPVRGGGSPGQGGRAGGKTGQTATPELVPMELILARLRAVTPLAYSAQARRRSMHGTILVRFRMNDLGYPSLMQLLRSSGHPVLDGEAANILHLAEPYPHVEGWVVVPITF